MLTAALGALWATAALLKLRSIRVFGTYVTGTIPSWRPLHSLALIAWELALAVGLMAPSTRAWAAHSSSVTLTIFSGFIAFRPVIGVSSVSGCGCFLPRDPRSKGSVHRVISEWATVMRNLVLILASGLIAPTRWVGAVAAVVVLATYICTSIALVFGLRTSRPPLAIRLPAVSAWYVGAVPMLTPYPLGLGQSARVIPLIDRGSPV